MDEKIALEVIRTALTSYIENCSGVRTPETKEIEKAWKVISKGADEPYSVAKLAGLICDDEDRYKDTKTALKLLIKQANIDGTVMADDIVLMWAKVENSFTVDELLTAIEN